MIPRQAEKSILKLAKGFPVIGLTGPRQSGKTTLARALFPDKPYVSLEDPAHRAFALEDPRGFLARYPQGAIFDEAQRWPDLFSYLQGLVDEHRRMGEFILTGSQQFGLVAGITQSLAGRIGLVNLLPLSLAELTHKITLDTAMWMGGYPILHAQKIEPATWLANYVTTYIERDVRQVLNIQDLTTFQRFLRLCAARTGQLLNLSNVASEAGISHVTARAWLSVLESSYLIHLLPPYYQNFGKRLVKTPKLYFLDVGLACWLLGIHSSELLALHPFRGALFETLIVSELIKARYNQGQRADLYFWRDNNGLEIDILFEHRGQLQPIEIKSGQTVTTDYIKSTRKSAKLLGDHIAGEPWLIYGGKENYLREGVQVMNWQTPLVV